MTIVTFILTICIDQTLNVKILQQLLSDYEAGMYKLGTKEGCVYSKNQFEPFPNPQMGFVKFHADKSIKGGHPGYNIIIFLGSVTSHDHSRAKFQR